jgi:hypothetical protein
MKKITYKEAGKVKYWPFMAIDMEIYPSLDLFEDIDELLKPFGLELLVADTDNNYKFIKIIKI